jgi:hypothetical protein
MEHSIHMRSHFVATNDVIPVRVDTSCAIVDTLTTPGQTDTRMTTPERTNP